MNYVSMDKKYKTRTGKDVRIMATDAKGEYPVVALVIINEYKDAVIRCDEEGYFRDRHNPHPDDLVEVIPEQWVNVYISDETGVPVFGETIFDTEDQANALISERKTSRYSRTFLATVKLPDGVNPTLSVDAPNQWFPDNSGTWIERQATVDLPYSVGLEDV